MKVLVVGSGGREHALVWKLAQSEHVEALYAAPGNPGMADQATCVDRSVNDIAGLAAFAEENAIDLTVVGPERPLAAGIADVFRQKGLAVFGPSKAASQLEASKVFSKVLMRDHGVPTCGFEVFDNPENARAYVKRKYDVGEAVVIKADGLAEGKGAIMTSSRDEADAAIRLIMEDQAFGASGSRILVEDRISGEEASIFSLCDGEEFVTLVPSQDHKRIFDGDQGPNTGGMGAYAPVPLVDAGLLAQVEKEIVAPTLQAMVRRGEPYRGVLYTGIMLTPSGPSVIEFNCRFGDPEAQVVLPMMESDLAEALWAAANGKLSEVKYRNRSGAAACIVCASGGYPGSYPKGLEIHGLAAANAVKDAAVFHAGTARKGNALVTAGGRVLGVTAWGADLAAAIDKAYDVVDLIRFDGMQYRKDIGGKGLTRLGLAPGGQI